MRSLTPSCMCVCILYNCFCSSEDLWLAHVFVVQNSFCSRISVSLHGGGSTWPGKNSASPPVRSPSLFAMGHLGQDGTQAWLSLNKGENVFVGLVCPFIPLSSYVCILEIPSSAVPENQWASTGKLLCKGDQDLPLFSHAELQPFMHTGLGLSFKLEVLEAQPLTTDL